MRTRYCRDLLVLIRWLAYGRICLLLQLYGGGTLAVYEPAGDGPFEELPPGALAVGLEAFRGAMATARRVIETGREERNAWQRSAQLQNMELGDMDDQAALYARSITAFERAHGRGSPITEDLTQTEASGARRR